MESDKDFCEKMLNEINENITPKRLLPTLRTKNIVFASKCLSISSSFSWVTYISCKILIKRIAVKQYLQILHSMC